MTREKLEKLTKEAVMSELSQNFLDGREILDFDEVLNVVQAVVKNCSIPYVVGQSEQLVAFCRWYNQAIPSYETTEEEIVETYLRESN